MNPPETSVNAPTPPQLTVRVAVVGHRLQKLAASDLGAIESRTREVLAVIQRASTEAFADARKDFSGNAPQMRVLSALAEGADRIGARVGLLLGYEFQCPIPRSRALYAEDFAAAESKADFADLLSKSTSVLELDGDRDPAPIAYARVGHTLVRQADMLVAIWDGAEASGAGGTGEVVASARALGVPVIWIRSTAPHAVRMLAAVEDEAMAPETREWVLAVHDVVRRLVVPAADSPDRILRHDLLRTDLPHLPALKVFAHLKGWLQGVAHSTPHESPHVAGTPSPAATNSVPDVFDRAGDLADFFGNWYRDSFVINYLLGALAVVAALLGFELRIATVFELIFIALILGITWTGRRKNWHERWLYYRVLAEQRRPFLLLQPLGRVAPTFRVPVHASDADPSSLWLAWCYRMYVAERGLASGVMNGSYLAACRDRIRALLEEQRAYHRNAAHLNHALHETVQSLGKWLFTVTAVVCLIHLWHGFGEVESPLNPVNELLTLLAAGLPAFGAAFAGIASQSEFGRLANRSESMAARLDVLTLRLNRAPATSDAYGGIAEEIAEMMGAELFDWQVTFRGKPLELG